MHPHDSIDGACASQITAVIIDAPPASEGTRLVSGSRARAHHQASRSTPDFPLEAHEATKPRMFVGRPVKARMWAAMFHLWFA